MLPSQETFTLYSVFWSASFLYQCIQRHLRMVADTFFSMSSKRYFRFDSKYFHASFVPLSSTSFNISRCIDSSRSCCFLVDIFRVHQILHLVFILRLTFFGSIVNYFIPGWLFSHVPPVSALLLVSGSSAETDIFILRCCNLQIFRMYSALMIWHIVSLFKDSVAKLTCYHNEVGPF